ncbi:MAG: nitrate reductase molybdenum cofactor assembly chaperone [Omnitrophica WOR_2 bacterium]
MAEFTVFAEAFQYPRPGLASRLQAGIDEIQEGPSRTAFSRFLEGVTCLDLGEWEELYTRTLDLNPKIAPYIGYQVWGDTYPRGDFLSRLNQELARCSIDLEGELPDHLLPVLHYMDCAAAPMAELKELLPQALQAMYRLLKKTDPVNPYGFLLQAVEAAVLVKYKKED